MQDLTRIRNERGWSQQKLSDASGVNKATINQIERGRRSPNVETLEKLADALGVEMADFFPKEQASLPFDDDSGQRRLLYISAWSNLIDELAGDMEEWRYAELGALGDPADLPERDFLLFIRGAAPFAYAYRRIYRTVREELVPALRAESPTGPIGREIEKFERAVRRLSRVVLSVVTTGVEQRVAQMALERERGKKTRQDIPSNVVSLFAKVRENAA